MSYTWFEKAKSYITHEVLETIVSIDDYQYISDAVNKDICDFIDSIKEIENFKIINDIDINSSNVSIINDQIIVLTSIVVSYNVYVNKDDKEVEDEYSSW